SHLNNTEPVIQFINFDEFLDFYSEQLEEFTKNKKNKADDFQLNITCIISFFLFDGLSKKTSNQIAK
ncbi:15195_t:CDS:1, partial [Funneliformis caledonium]